MPLIRGASALVIRCFRRFERCADALTGAAGPVFIVLAWALTVMCGVVFFDVVARGMSFWANVLLLPAYILVPLNMYGHYYLVTHVPPGFPSARDAREARWLAHNPHSLLAPERWGWERRRGDGDDPSAPVRGPPQMWSAPGGAEGRRVRRCRKCDGPKPERTHHCSVCKRCVLLMDHHCPWINACVGLFNQRYFVLFMAWLGLGCWMLLIFGYPHFWNAIVAISEWPGRTPRALFALAYILAVAMGVAVPVLDGWHLYMVARGETSIEAHDNEYLDKKAAAEGLVYLNPYALGRRRNLQLFFNVGPGGYPARTLLFPLVVPPYSNGWSWPRRALPPDAAAAGEDAEGLDAPTEEARALLHTAGPSAGASIERGRGDGPGGRYVMGGQEELTDDEDGGGGWWDERARSPSQADRH